jgi:hypothetical protein
MDPEGRLPMTEERATAYTDGSCLGLVAGRYTSSCRTVASSSWAGPSRPRRTTAWSCGPPSRPCAPLLTARRSPSSPTASMSVAASSAGSRNGSAMGGGPAPASPSRTGISGPSLTGWRARVWSGSGRAATPARPATSVATLRQGKAPSPGSSYLSLVDGIIVRHPTWAACERRVHGVRGARYRKVRGEDEARALVAAWGLPPDALAYAERSEGEP